MANVYQKQWDFLAAKHAAGKLGHAYILAGGNAQAKEQFALDFVKSAYDSGEASRMIDQGIFADLLVVKKAEDKGELEIAKVKEIQQFLALAPYYGKMKCVIVLGAETMNQEAQSRFLKTLEEPPGNALILLLASHADLLLETIRSRCQKIQFFGSGAPDADKGAMQALMAALEGNLADKFAFAKEADAKEQDVAGILQAMEAHFRELLLVAIGIGPLAKQNKKYSVERLQSILRTIEAMQKQLLFTNASKRLALEVALLET